MQLETTIKLLNKNMKIIQRADYFSFSIDSLLVSDFASITRNCKNIIDLGSGNGVIPLFLSERTQANIFGIEIQKISSELATRNVELNNLSSQIKIINDNMLNWKKYFRPTSIDLVVSNPPFFRFTGNEEQLNQLNQLSIARHEIEINLDLLVKTASELLKDKGYFTMVHRVDRVVEIIETFRKYNIEPKKIQFCYSKITKEGKILLIEGIKYGNQENLRVLPPLITHNEDGSYSDIILEKFNPINKNNL